MASGVSNGSDVNTFPCANMATPEADAGDQSIATSLLPTGIVRPHMPPLPDASLPLIELALRLVFSESGGSSRRRLAASCDWQLQSELKVEAEMEVDLDGYYPRTPLRSIAQLGRISCQEGPEELAYAAYSDCVQR
jgi:hypothetical protein